MILSRLLIWVDVTVGRPDPAGGEDIGVARPIDSDPRALAILHEWVKMTGVRARGGRLGESPTNEYANRIAGMDDSGEQ
jgi:hypothetical protein